MRRAIYCALISAAAGFGIAAYVSTVDPSTAPRWMSTTVAYILCPPGILAGITMTDPDAESIWLFFGPLNALIYGAVGFTLAMALKHPEDAGSQPDSESRAHSDRPLDL
ncbi:MAG: hypothetical protein WB952_11345 [Terriglobales bacterium]